MGECQSKDQTTSVISVNADSPGVVHSNDGKTEEIERLVENIRNVLKQMKQDVESNNLLPNGIFRGLFKDLESLNNVLDPQRMHICYVVGGTCAGKSSLINSIVKKEICKVSDTEVAGTDNFQIIPVPEVNTTFVDTIGFGSQSNDSSLVKRFKTKLKTDNLPDSILLVVTQEQLRNIASLKTTIDYINGIVEYLESIRHNTSVPIICVLNKIDQYFPNGLNESEDCTKNIEKSLQKAQEIVNKFLKTKVTMCIATSPHKDYGIDMLRLNINAQSPLNAQIIDSNWDYIQKHRWIIANKIIAAFSTTSAAVSFLPIADIIIVTMLQEWLYKMLACFSVDQNRTPETFKTVHRTLQVSSLAIRAGSLFVGGVFQLSLVGYLIGSSICVATAATSTAALGWACYYYFVNETPPKEHKK